MIYDDEFYEEYCDFSPEETEDDHCDCSNCMECLGMTEKDFF